MFSSYSDTISSGLLQAILPNLPTVPRVPDSPTTFTIVHRIQQKMLCPGLALLRMFVEYTCPVREALVVLCSEPFLSKQSTVSPGNTAFLEDFESLLLKVSRTSFSSAKSFCPDISLEFMETLSVCWPVPLTFEDVK